MIHVLDKRRAEDVFVPIVDTIAIRCKSSSGEVCGELKGRYLDILPLVFDDVLPIPKRFKVKEDKYIIFSENQANRVADFLENYFGQFKDMMISCDYGVSRSAALGVAIGEHFKWEYDPIIIGDEHQHPNDYVYTTMRDVLVVRFPDRNITRIH